LSRATTRDGLPTPLSLQAHADYGNNLLQDGFEQYMVNGIPKDNEAFNESHVEQAFASLQRALALDPTVLVAQYNIGRIHIARKEHKSAVRVLRGLLADLPENALLALYGWQELGSALLSLHEDAEAEAAFRRMLALQWSNPIGNGQLAETLIRQKRSSEAVSHLEELFRKLAVRDAHPSYRGPPMEPPLSYYLHLTAAQAYSDAKNVTGACVHAREAQQYNPQGDRAVLMRCSRHDEQQKRAAEARAGNPRGERRAVLQPIDRRHELSLAEFVSEYATPRRPVVIVGAVERMGVASRWGDLRHLAAICGERPAQLKRQRADSTKWAGLEPIQSDNSTVAEFVARVEDSWQRPLVGGEHPPSRGLRGATGVSYLFDWGLPKLCPELLEGFIVPEYFAQDLLQRTPAVEADQYREQWPSLFLGPKGSGCNLHTDSLGSHFWMALVSGRKEWRVFSPESAAYLKPNAITGSFDIDAFQEEQAAEFYAADMHGTVLEAGDIVFVPAGSPHQVRNIEDTVAISGNYIDATNFEQALKELDELRQSTGPVAQKAESLRGYFTTPGFDASINMAAGDARYPAFKAGHGARRMH